MNDVQKRESPCVDLCVIHRESGLCMGCFRTIDEISSWGNMPPKDRESVMKALPSRAPLVRGTRRGGRKSRR